MLRGEYASISEHFECYSCFLSLTIDRLFCRPVEAPVYAPIWAPVNSPPEAPTPEFAPELAPIYAPELAPVPTPAFTPSPTPGIHAFRTSISAVLCSFTLHSRASSGSRSLNVRSANRKRAYLMVSVLACDQFLLRLRLQLQPPLLHQVQIPLLWLTACFCMNKLFFIHTRSRNPEDW